jgi:hypothetical protein
LRRRCVATDVASDRLVTRIAVMLILSARNQAWDFSCPNKYSAAVDQKAQSSKSTYPRTGKNPRIKASGMKTTTVSTDDPTHARGVLVPNRRW